MLGLLGGYTTRPCPGIDIAGDANVLPSLLGVLDKGDPSFNIVTP
jgi:alkyl sulfatase BDS1-like metallo-beta-lactamase superfamily hydrolase